MPLDHAPTQQAIALAAQADLVLLTAEMLRSPPRTTQSVSPPWYALQPQSLHLLLRHAFADASPSAASPAPISLDEALDEVLALAGQLDHEAWSDEYFRLFDSSQACTLNQASYIRRDKGAILGDLCGFYNAFGWQGNLASGERPDHLLCQLEFTGVLLAMAARAEDDGQRQIVETALSQFTRLHMADWLPSVCCHLVDTTRLAYFGAVAQWLALLWARLTATHAWPVDAVPDAPLPTRIEPADPYECGAPDLVQLEVSSH